MITKYLMKAHFSLCLLIALLICSCSRLPVEKLSQLHGKIVNYEIHNDSLIISINNPLHSPIRISSTSSKSELLDQLDSHFPLTIKANQDSLLSYWTHLSEEDIGLKFSAIMGNPNDSVRLKKIHLPFPKGSQYKINQGYNGSFSHTSEYSRFALDFNLNEGDTVTAAADGYVVGVIEGYSKGGRTKAWRDYANFITLFHPEMNAFTQYAHLKFEGSLVEVGDFVIAEQAIGLAGQTGFASSPHLHFNVLIANETGVESTQVEFIEGYKGVDLKKGTRVKN